MAKKRLTEASVKRTKPTPGKQLVIFDEVMRGLVLTVSPGGTRSWSVLHYVGGKPKYHGLGRYPLLPLKEARDRAFEFLRDPEAKQSKTFAEVADDFIKRHVEGKLRTESEIKRVLNRYVRPRWSERPFTQIRRGDVTELLDQVEDNHGAPQADMVLAWVRMLMNWYQTRHDDYANPIVKGMARTKRTERARTRILNDDEIRAVWNACDGMGTFGALIQMLLLTGQRRDKVARMQWDDLNDGTWHIRTETREKGNAGTLKLPDMALAIIAKQPRLVGNPHVFPSTRGKGAFSLLDHVKPELDAELPDMPHWTVHDLRRTARSLMSRAGVSFEVAEQVLGHVVPGVAGIYARYDFNTEKADALNRLAVLVERILEPPTANVVPLPIATTA